MLGMILSLLSVSCSKEKDEDSTRINFTADEAFINSKIDFANDDVNKVTEEQLNINDGIAGKNVTASNALFLPACATVTRVPAIGTLPVVGSTVVKTIDFGTIGCPMPNGNVLRGKIILTFLFEPTATTHVINCTFENFYHNLRKIEGTKTFTRTMTAQTPAFASHPVWSMNMNLVITLPDGRVLNRVGTRTSEIIAGYATPLDWTDNVYSVTGNWTTTFPNTNFQTSTITNPLIVKFACVPNNSPISQGIISFVRNSQTATLDYGNGTCDNQAIFTINGISYPITLGN